MNRPHVLGGIGAILQTVYFVALILTIGVLMPSEGFTPDADSFHTPSIALPYAQTSILYPEYYVIAGIFGLGLLLAGLGTYEIFKEVSPVMRFALIAGVVGFGIELIEMTVGVKVIREIAAMYPASPEAGSAYLAVNLVTGGLRTGAWNMYGWWALLTCWAGWKTGKLPRWLCYSGLLVGPLAIITFITSDLSLVHNFLGFVFPISVGVALLRQSPARAAAGGG